MRIRITQFLTLLPLFGAAPAAGQLPVPIVIEGRAGYAIPVGDFGSSTVAPRAESGPSFALGARVEVVPRVSIFGEYQQMRFGCKDCDLLEIDDTMVLEGVEFGVHVVSPRGIGGLSPWIRGGVLRQTLGFSNDDDRLTSSAAFGFSAAAGVTAALGARLELSPGVRFVSVPTTFEFSAAPDRSADVTGISFDIGLAYRL